MALAGKARAGILRRADCDVRKFTWDMTPAEKETWAEGAADAL
jgi:hypothetical protein